MIDTTTSSLTMMKFCINHPYKFQRPYYAFCIILVQFFAQMMIEFANVLLLLCTSDVISMISNFVSLVILT